MKFFSIFFYIGVPVFLLLLFGYFSLGGIENMMEYYKNIGIKYAFYQENIDIFTLNFHFYLLVFFAIFLTFWGGLMSGKIKPIYAPLIVSGILFSVGHNMESVKYQYYFFAIIPFIIFIILIFTSSIFGNQIGFLRKISERKKNDFKMTSIERSGEFLRITTNYSIQINKRPSQKALYKTIHPITGEEFIAQSEASFDPLFSFQVPKKTSIYFDRHDKNKYLIDLDI